MAEDEFDVNLVDAAFALGAERGWRHVSAAAAARHGGLDAATARARFTRPGAILAKFGQLADAHALTGALQDGTVKDRLFDTLLRRFDFLQGHRAGVIALLRVLPLDAPLAAWLAKENLRSMGWLLESTGVSATGLRGALRKRGLSVVWTWGVRAWIRDESEDLSATMAAVDVALTRADQIAARFSRDDGFTPETEEAAPESPIDTPD